MLTGAVAARQGDLAALLRWVAAAFSAIAIAGLTTRLAPHAFSVSGGVVPERLAFPLTYWNAMGIASALGLLLLLHVSASGEERRTARALAAALGVPVAVALYFTFSRGAIWVLPAGAVAYVLLAQARGLVTALPCLGLPAAIAVKAAYGADLLSRADYATAPGAVAQGRRLAVIVVACAVAAGALRAGATALDARIEAIQVAPERLRRLRLVLVAGTLVVLLLAALAVHAPRRIADARATFARGGYITSNTGDLRQRLTSAVDNGRVAVWRVALAGFDESPLHGTGAGTYRLTWERRRSAPPAQMTDGHSLYLETLSELGVPGLMLVLAFLGTPLVVALRRLGGPERHAYAAFVAAGAMLAVHAGVDWDWEMPALFVWLFGAGGVVLAARTGAERWGPLGRTARIVAALAVLVLVLTPALMVASQAPLRRSITAFARSDCKTAIHASLDAIGRFGVRPEPWEVLGYCDARAGQYALATRAMDAAHARDPRNWQYVYGQAIIAGVAGRDPRPAAAQALRLNPLEPLARTLVGQLRAAKSPARRRDITRRAGIPFE